METEDIKKEEECALNEECHDGKKKKDKKNCHHEKEIKSLKEEIEKLKTSIKELNNEKLRANAEAINYRKRKDEEVANMYKYCNEKLLKELLPVMDNFERAIALDDSNLTDELSKFLQGFKIIYARMRELLESFGVKEIDCQGKVFDPNLETSVFTGSDSNYDNEVVLEVLQKGYTYNDKLLRSASVKINNIEINKNKEGNDKNE